MDTMTTAANAVPGQVFKNPATGHVWRRRNNEAYPWYVHDQDGAPAGWATQADAEEANLVLMVPETDTPTLDVNNPEHQIKILRLAKKVMDSHGVTFGSGYAERLADRLEREAAAEARDKADRELAEEIADEVWSREESAWHIAQKAAQATLVRVRAEQKGNEK